MKEYLSDLLTEFDEMGYCPTTLCLDGEEQAIAWKKEIVEEIEKLIHRAEVAERAVARTYKKKNIEEETK